MRSIRVSASVHSINALLPRVLESPTSSLMRIIGDCASSPPQDMSHGILRGRGRKYAFFILISGELISTHSRCVAAVFILSTVVISTHGFGLFPPKSG